MTSIDSGSMHVSIAITVKCLVYLILIQSSFAFAFDFSFSAPAQCGDLSVSWSGMFRFRRVPGTLLFNYSASGGRPPFHLLITPVLSSFLVTYYFIS